MSDDKNNEDENLNKRELFKKTAKEWAETTTSHGIPNIVRTQYIIVKVIWILFFLTSTGYCTYTIVRSLIDYFKYDTTIKLNILRDSPTEFPAVTICNLNPYDYYYVDNSDYIEYLIQEYNLTIDTQYGEEEVSINQAYDDFFDDLKRIVSTDTKKDDEFRQQLGFDLETQMLLSCFYNKIPCNASHFKRFWSNQYGNCYTFNSGKDFNNNPISINQTTVAGINYGLQLELLVGDPARETKYAIKTGIFLAIHNKSTPTELLDDGVHIATGFDTYVPITRTFYTKKAYPYSNCIEDIEKYKDVSDYSKIIYGYMKELNISLYNQELCYDLCFQDHLADSCNCSELDIPIIRDLFYCQTNKELSCLSNITLQFTTTNVETLCQSSCPPQCYSIKYDLSDYTATYPTKYYYQQLLNTANRFNISVYNILYRSYNDLSEINESIDTILTLVKQNIVKLTVNYKDLTYTHIEEVEVITFETLLGVLGGQLGLFVGLSFLSFIEVLELLVSFIIILCKRKKGDKDLSYENARDHYFNRYNYEPNTMRVYRNKY